MEHQRQQSSTWPDDQISRDSRRPKLTSTSGRNSQGNLRKRQSGSHSSRRSTHSSCGLNCGEDSLHSTGLRSYKRKLHARCASTQMNRPNTSSLSVHSVHLFGPISDNG
ncbi:hypothetical protein Salat_1096400 [Sesamum alatum]|uniref:Uncharacterized protein n=1 Tax=Sesamum alatum TaxID=300844 RepID=A0AAE2CSW1_9LAMI|nr:hypothetical protein Salat_1096400 [Sesamum alatum]